MWRVGVPESKSESIVHKKESVKRQIAPKQKPPRAKSERKYLALVLTAGTVTGIIVGVLFFLLVSGRHVSRKVETTKKASIKALDVAWVEELGNIEHSKADLTPFEKLPETPPSQPQQPQESVPQQPQEPTKPTPPPPSPPKPSNTPPRVSISGPTQVKRGTPITYTVYIYDAEDGSKTTSITRVFTSDGPNSVSYTYTDSGGLSGSASLSVVVVP